MARAFDATNAPFDRPTPEQIGALEAAASSLPSRITLRRRGHGPSLMRSAHAGRVAAAA